MEVMKRIIFSEAQRIAQQAKVDKDTADITPIYAQIRQAASQGQFSTNYSTFGLTVDYDFIKNRLQLDGFTVQLIDIVDAQNRITDTVIKVDWTTPTQP
ncbi:hypothetical protein [Ralstonia phage RSP15]|uniref:hypothetical protein n=1 Tax=Ralstonia phage RSP15 TaxID=1785960 RepID=UPI00074D4535|nr:hypothetical protein BH754_gp017 [Ralstonia phage RSP15]BAU39975.1 hypothetical protein [Ralstonia phage RSP15]